eukprot:834148-Rhodomonas_salina.2
MSPLVRHVQVMCATRGAVSTIMLMRGSDEACGGVWVLLGKSMTDDARSTGSLAAFSLALLMLLR